MKKCKEIKIRHYMQISRSAEIIGEDRFCDLVKLRYLYTYSTKVGTVQIFYTVPHTLCLQCIYLALKCYSKDYLYI